MSTDLMLISKKGRTRVIALSVLGILIGAAFYYSPGGAFICAAAAMIYLFLRSQDQNGSRYLSSLFLYSFCIRIALLGIVSLLFVYFGKVLMYPGDPGWTPNLVGDSAYYTLRGYWMALDTQGVPVSDKIFTAAYSRAYGWHGYTYIIALFHYVFGFSPIASKMMSCLYGSLNGVLTYVIMKRFVSGKTAKLASILVVFLPSTLLWSITNLKDTFLAFTILVAIWSFNNIVAKNKIRSFLILLMASVAILSSIRTFIMMFFLAAAAVSAFFVLPRPRAVTKIIIASVMLIISLLVIHHSADDPTGFPRNMICRALSVHQASVNVPGSEYKVMEDKYYIIDRGYLKKGLPDYCHYLYPKQYFSYFKYFRVMFSSLIHFMYEPFPWNVDTKLKLFAYPQIVMWYLITPFVGIGILFMLFHRWKYALILFTSLVVISSGTALCMGNIGTVFRLRDMTSPIFLMLAAAGIGKVLGWYQADMSGSKKKNISKETNNYDQ